MKNNRRFFAIILSICLSFAAMLGTLTPIISYASDGTIYISSKEELLSFAKDCALDSWSKDKSFALTKDISLEDVEFSPIPFFSGSFDGQGHVISGLHINGAYAPAGLFSQVSEGGVIKNLTVEGCVTPSGDKGYVGGIVGDNRGAVENCNFVGTVIGKSDVGGIVGINRLSGTVSDCVSEGEIIGDNRTGGIVGTNHGLVSSSENEAKVNTISITPALTLEELNTALTMDVTKLPTIETLSRNDTGGIAGYSSGMILTCENRSEVGYKHIGYNLGGIAGRSSGHISGSTNSAAVYGRKDVGGIVGQAEPYVTYDLSEDLLAQLKGEMDNLHSLVNQLADSIDGTSTTVASRINKIINLLGNASESIDSIANGVSGWGDETISEVNRLSLVIAGAIDRFAVISEQLPALTENLSSSLEALEKCFTEMEDVSEIGRDALEDLNLSLEDAKTAVSLLGQGATEVESGLIALKESLKTEDGEGVKAALGDITDGIVDIATAVSTLSSATNKISEVMGGLSQPDADYSAALDELGAAFGEIGTSLSTFSEGMSKIAGGVQFIGEHVSLDIDKALLGIDIIGEGLSTVVDSSVALEDSIAHMRDCVDHVIDASVELDEAMAHLKNAVASLKSAADITTEILIDAHALIDYLSGVDPVQIPTPPESIKEDADQLFLTISSLESTLKSLNAHINTGAGELTDILRQMNDSISNMMNSVVSAIYGLNEKDYDDEVTAEEVDSVTLGKIFDCTNLGTVYGDINVGGIGGIMGLEYSLDPEDDLSEEITVTQKRNYKLKAVIHSCKNLGEVTAKRNCVGGILGKGDLGLIYENQAYCKVNSEGGSYVGGIVGISAADVTDCYAKCTLSGKKYLGGIIGSGVSEDYSGDSSLVKGCVSIVRISSFTQYAGAISGIYAGEFANNRFVSDDLQGIDLVSYQGKAEPVSYEELVKERSLPSELYDFTLTFLADGKVIKTHSFEYGASFGREIFPDIPEKYGYYSYWDKDTLENLTFDTTVTAIYHPIVSALGSSEERENGRDIFIVQGVFTEEDGILLSKEGVNLSGLTLPKGLFYEGNIAENWLLTLPEGKVISGIRYLPEAKSFDLYIKQNGVWIKADTEKFGSYTIFHAGGEQIEIAVVTYTANILNIFLACILAGLIITAIILPIAFRGRIKERIRERKEKKK